MSRLLRNRTRCVIYGGWTAGSITQRGAVYLGVDATLLHVDDHLVSHHFELRALCRVLLPAFAINAVRRGSLEGACSCLCVSLHSRRSNISHRACRETDFCFLFLRQSDHDKVNPLLVVCTCPGWTLLLLTGHPCFCLSHTQGSRGAVVQGSAHEMTTRCSLRTPR